jgi:SAM-dependent methyltransferase
MIYDTLESPSVPYPPSKLQIEVLGQATPIADFFYGGYMVAQGLREALALVGRPLSTFSSLLDLGCGCGRVLRWFQDDARTTRLYGSDISDGAIAWDREHLPFAQFDVNGEEPPLAYPDGSFDLVIAVSVVTHLSEELQLAWLAEVKRVLRPGGLLLMTVLGDDGSTQRLNGQDLAEYLEKGHHYKRVEDGGLHGLPDFYQDAFHSRAYVERVWSRFLKLRAYIRHGPLYTQDLVVLENVPGHRGECGPYIWMELPICSIGAPAIGSTVAGDVLPMFGSAFSPRGGTVQVDVWVDGRRIASVPANLESAPGIARAYPAWPSAARSTFEGRFPIKGLSSGPHTLTMTGSTNLVAASSTYFFTP